MPNFVLEFVTIFVVPLFVALFSAWGGAKFGFRKGLEQARQESAFDRSLEWYENAIRAMSRFSDSAWQLRHELVFSKEPNQSLKYLAVLEKRTSDLESVLEESVLFADAKTIVELREDIFGLDNELLSRAQDLLRQPSPARQDLETVSEFAVIFAKRFRNIALRLSQKIRVELGLEKIHLEDLKTFTEKSLEAENENRTDF